MAGIWDTIKKQGDAAPRDVANADGEIAFDPPRGAPVRVHRDETLKFRPVNPAAVMTDEQAWPSPVEGCKPINSTELAAYVDLENPNLDLVADDVVLVSTKQKNKGGRPRTYSSNANRQAAYRERKRKSK